MVFVSESLPVVYEGYLEVSMVEVAKVWVEIRIVEPEVLLNCRVETEVQVLYDTFKILEILKLQFQEAVKLFICRVKGHLWNSDKHSQTVICKEWSKNNKNNKVIL